MLIYILLILILIIVISVIYRNRQIFIVNPRFTIVSVDHFFVKSVHRYKRNGFSMFYITEDITEKDRVLKETNHKVTVDRHLFGFKRREEWYQQSETNNYTGWIRMPDGVSNDHDRYALTKVFDVWLIEQSYLNQILENEPNN